MQEQKSKLKHRKKIRRIISFDSVKYEKIKSIANNEERPISWFIDKALDKFIAEESSDTKMLKQRLAEKGIDKELIGLVGIVKDSEDTKKSIREAVAAWAIK